MIHFTAKSLNYLSLLILGLVVSQHEAFIPIVPTRVASVRQHQPLGRKLFLSSPTKEKEQLVANSTLPDSVDTDAPSILDAKKGVETKAADRPPKVVLIKKEEVVTDGDSTLLDSVDADAPSKLDAKKDVTTAEEGPETKSKLPRKKPKLYEDPLFVLDGEAKAEEPGDRDRIASAIKQYQFDTWKEEPSIPVGTILQRTLDTAEDAFLHLRRVPYDKGWFLEPVKEDRQTIVVLGSGWAAHALLKVADPYKLRIIVVSPSNHFVFTPMLASASVGTVEYRSMTEAVRSANPMIHNYLEGTATDIDIEKKIIHVKMNSLLDGIREPGAPELDISYDKLVVAVGCKVADSLVPGAFEHSLRLKTCDDARRLRNAVGEAFEYGSRPEVKDDESLSEPEREKRREERRKRLTFCIVGGGPTGVELAGELGDFVKDITKPRVGAYPDLGEDVRIVLIQGGKDLVPQFEEDLRKHALVSLTKSGVEVRFNTRVNQVGDGFVKLIEKGEGKVEETLSTGLNVWAAGTEPVPFTKTLLEKLPEEARGIQGKINVDPWLRPPMPDNAEFGSIMVMGDATSFSDRENSFLPQTAQVAGQQGAYAARMLDRGYDLSVTPPQLANGTEAMNAWLRLRGLEKAEGFKFLNLGLLAYVGGGEALTQVTIGDVPVFSYAGSVAFLLWRSTYLVKQVATRNRILVTFDWVKSAIFGRDITRL